MGIFQQTEKSTPAPFDALRVFGYNHLVAWSLF